MVIEHKKIDNKKGNRLTRCQWGQQWYSLWEKNLNSEVNNPQYFWEKTYRTSLPFCHQTSRTADQEMRSAEGHLESVFSCQVWLCLFPGSTLREMVAHYARNKIIATKIKHETSNNKVRATWEDVLKREGDLPNDWIHNREVLFQLHWRRSKRGEALR